MTPRPAPYPAQGLPPGLRWWNVASCAPVNRCWCRARAAWRYSPCKSQKRTGGSDEKLALAKKLGASQGINRLKGDWAENTLALTQDRGIDHIIETVGGENLKHSLSAVAVHGRISVIGVLAGTEITLSAGELLLKSPVIQGIGVGHLRALEDFVRAVDVTGLKPVIEHRYRFNELEQAFEHLDRGAFGKIVLTRE